MDNYILRKLPKRNYKWIEKTIAGLDPATDYAEIWRLTSTYYSNDFILNLVYTLAIPSFTQPPAGSQVMGMVTEKAIKSPQKRVDDTLQHFWAWFEFGPNDARVQASIAHINKIHMALSKKSPGAFPARDVIYTTAWVGANLHRLRLAVGLPGFTENQQIASQKFWSEMCRQFWSEDGYVLDFPPTFEAMLKFIEDYEAEAWPQVESGKILTEAIIKQFVDTWFPHPIEWLGRQIYLSLQIPSIRKLMRSGEPNAMVGFLVRKGIGLTLTIQERILPDPKCSVPEKARTKRNIPIQHLPPPMATIQEMVEITRFNAKESAEIKCPFHQI